MEAVTQTARAARRYLGVLLSGDDAARKQLVFSPGRVSNRADVGAGEPARDRSDVSGSRARASAPRSGASVARAPAEGADAPRVSSRFAVEAAQSAGKRKRVETEGAMPSTRTGAASRVVTEDRGARVRAHPASVGTDGDERRLKGRPVGPPRSILAVGGAKRKRDGEETPRDAALSRRVVSAGGSGAFDAPAATRRRLDLLRSVGVVKTSGGVPSTYDLGARANAANAAFFSVAAFETDEGLDVVDANVGGRVKLATRRGANGGIAGFFRAGANVARGRRRFRAAATDPNIVRAELIDLPSDVVRVAPPANAKEDVAGVAGVAVAAPPAFSFGSADAATPSLALGAGSTRRSKSRKGREDDDDSLLGAALRDFNGGKTKPKNEPPKSALPKPEEGQSASAAFAFGAPADAAGGGSKSASTPNPPAAASTGFTFGAAPAGTAAVQSAAGGDAKTASTPNPPAAASTGFTFGAAPAGTAAVQNAAGGDAKTASTPNPPTAASTGFTFGAAPASATSAPFAFGGAAAPPGGGMSLGPAGPAAGPAGRRAVRARRPGRR